MIKFGQIKKQLFLGIILGVGLFVLTGYGEACTIFFLNGGDQQIVAKNHDFMAPDGFLIANKRNIEKTAFVYLGQTPEEPAKWTSKYGSVTQNQYGRELPYGGINESGLVVEMLMMPQTKYPMEINVPTISQLQWVQYQLDTRASVIEVLENLDSLRIRPTPKAPGLHYFIADKTGDCAVVEFLDGKVLSYHDTSLHYKILTNSPYAQCLESVKTGHAPAKDVWLSNERFIRTAIMLKEFDPKSGNPLEFAFEILSNIKWEAPNQWTLAYDLMNHRIYFRAKNNGSLRHINMNQFDFTCASPTQAINISGKGTGEASDDIVEFSADLNRDLIKSTLGAFSLGPEASARVFDHRNRYLENAVRCLK